MVGKATNRASFSDPRLGGGYPAASTPELEDLSDVGNVSMDDLMAELEALPVRPSARVTGRKTVRTTTRHVDTPSLNVPRFSGDKIPSNAWRKAVDQALSQAGVSAENVVLHWAPGDRLDGIAAQGLKGGGATSYGQFVFGPKFASQKFGINACDAIVVLRKSDFKVTNERTAGGSGITEYVPRAHATPLAIIDPKKARAFMPKRRLL